MRFYSPIPNIDVPNVDIPTFVFDYAKKSSIFGTSPNLACLTDDTVSYSFAETESLTSMLASGLSNKLGIKRGDVVAVVLPNTAIYSIVAMAIHMIGAICTTANPGYTARELAHQFKLTEVKSVITIKERIIAIKESLKLANLVIPDSHINTIDGNNSNSISNVYSNIPFDRVYLKTEEEAKTTVAYIVFSSGTSGTPKGVMLSHRNIISNILQNSAFETYDKDLAQRLDGITTQKAVISVLPMFHIFALTCTLHIAICSGWHAIIMKKFDLGQFCALSQRHNASFACVVPSIILGLAKHPIVDKYDLSSYAEIVSGAAPLAKELKDEAIKRLGVPVVRGYGMSETSPILTRTLLNAKNPEASGILLSNIVAKVIDDNGKELKVGEMGELCFKGPNIMLGYLKNKQATKESIDDEGFFRTGDIGYFDEEGNCVIADRKKELIKYKGFQVAPAELEGLLTDHPGVLDSAVIPVYDESRASEIPKAFVVLCPDMDKPGIEKEIVKWVDSKVIDYKRLRGGVEVIDEIPKSVSGKILRRILRDREAMNKRKQMAKL